MQLQVYDKSEPRNQIGRNQLFFALELVCKGNQCETTLKNPHPLTKSDRKWSKNFWYLFQDQRMRRIEQGGSFLTEKERLTRDFFRSIFWIGKTANTAYTMPKWVQTDVSSFTGLQEGLETRMLNERVSTQSWWLFGSEESCLDGYGKLCNM